MANPTGKGGFIKGQSGNPLGVSPEVAAAREALRAALAKDATEVHEALMYLVKERNPQAVIYAHQQLHGKPVEVHEVTGADGGPLRVSQEMPAGELRDIVDAFKEKP